jgi:parallel beta-helix repeat protein
VYTASTNAGVYNNTITANTLEGIALQYYASGPTAKNNIVFANGSGVVDYGGTGSPILANNPTTDPLFVGGGNYRLTAPSPARDAGSTVAAVTDDFDGIARPQNGVYDIGAFEYH